MRKAARSYLTNTLLLLLLCSFYKSTGQVLCPPNIDFEEGTFNHWQCYYGKASVSGGSNMITVSPTAPLPGRHTIISAGNSFADPFGGFPMLCPNGSNYTVKLGNSSTGADADRIDYLFTIPADAHLFSLVYNYAVVFEDPGHAAAEQPRFIAKVFDVATNNYVSCATFDFIATASLPGFMLSNSPAPGTTNHDVWYKSWTPVTINLSGMEGKTIRVEFTTSDCTRGGHFGYAYVDVNANCSSPVLGTTICPGSDSAVLTAPFGYRGYNWFDKNFNQNLGSGSTLTLKPPPTTNTTYAVEVTPYDGYGCKDTLYATMKLGTTPSVDAGPDIAVCPGTVTQLGKPGSAVQGYTYSWSPVTSLSAKNIPDPFYNAWLVPATTTFDYVLTATNLEGCSNTDTVKVTNYAGPSSKFTVNSATQCLDQNNVVISHNMPPDYTYTWDFGDGTVTSAVNPPAHKYNADGQYTIRLRTTSQEGCADSTKQVITVNKVPVVKAGLPLALCDGVSGQLGAPATSGNKYSWSPATYLSDPLIADPQVTGTNLTQSVTINYVVTATDITTGCFSKDSVLVNMTAKPSTAFSVNNKDQCIDDNNFVFTNLKPGNAVYRWSFGDNTNSTGLNAAPHHYNQDGSYIVELSASAGTGCKDTTRQTVNVHALPTGTLSAAASIICEGNPVSITANGNVPVYNWYYNGIALSTPHDSIFNALQGGRFSAQFVSQYGCKSMSNAVQLTLVKKPVPDFAYDKYCIGLPTHFINNTVTTNSGAVTYSWKFGNDDSSAVKDPTVFYSKPGVYKVRLTATPQQCPNIATSKERSVLIEVPRKGISYEPRNAVAGQPLYLEARSYGQAYRWSPSINLSSLTTPVTTFQGIGEQRYTVDITAPSGCVTTDTQLVRMFVNVEIFVPKGFTPNGDGQNDKIYPFLVGIQQLKYFRIINRWGAVVYQATTDLPGWDGTYKGQPQPMDGYVWEAEAVDINGNIIRRSGNLTLIR